MNNEDRIELGYYCEELLSQDYFNVVAQQFDRQCFEHFMAAETPTAREWVYAQMRGAQDFLQHLKAYVDQKDAILKQIEALSKRDDEDYATVTDALNDEPIEGID